MKITKIIFAILLVFNLLTINIFAQAEDESECYDEDANICDYYCEQLQLSVGTEKALKYCDSLYYAALNDTTMEGYVPYALQTKASTYLSLNMYNRTIEFADSLIAVHDKTPIFGLKDINYIHYVIAIAYFELGQYKLAIKKSQWLYDQSKEYENVYNDLYKNRNNIENNISESEDNSTEDPSYYLDESYDCTIPIFVIVRCNSLLCLGLANAELGNIPEGIQYYDEGIKLIKAHDPCNALALNKLELQTYRMQAAQKFSDKDLALNYIEEYSSQIDTFRQNAIGTDMENLFIEDNVLLMHLAYASIYCGKSNAKAAKMHLEQAESIIKEYQLVDQYEAELNDAKTKYYLLIGDYDKANEVADKSINFFHNVSKRSNELNALLLKHDAVHFSRHYEKEYDIVKRILALKDTINDENAQSLRNEMQTIHEVDNIQLRNKALENESDALRARQQFLITIILLAILAIFLVLILMKRKRDKERQRILSQQKQLLEEEVKRQTHELREQKDVIEQKNRDITDSINYAQRIQKSILPDFKGFGEGNISGAFVFFIPCNIVSGDFYWATQRNEHLYFACADCTGHGVPGAFMSMIGTTILNEVSKQSSCVSPSELLEQLHINLLSILQQSGEADSRDGMDISVLDYNINTHKVRVSAARRPVCFFINGELVEYKAVKRSIGERDYSRETMPFSEEEYDVNVGDTVYLFSDGFPDQFGGPTENGKRLKYGGMIRMLEQLSKMPIAEQGTAIEKMYYDWRGNCPQYDDISLVGIKF